MYFPPMPDDGIESGNFLARCHQPPAGPFWKPILKCWLLAGGITFWMLVAWRLVRFIDGVFQ